MENNKLIRVKDGLFSKILKKLKLLLFKNVKKQDNKEEHTIIKTNMMEEIKVNFKNASTYEKEQFMKEISKNPDLLKNFSLNRLEKIKEYYENSIKTKRQILKNMKKRMIKKEKIGGKNDYISRNV